MALSILPLPWAVQWWQPGWVLLVLVYWLFSQPERMGFFLVFSLGLFLDLLLGSVLGLHALLFVCMAYFILRYHRQLSGLPPWQKSLLMLPLLLAYWLLKYWLLLLIGFSGLSGHFFYGLFSSFVIWPFLSYLLTSFQSPRGVVSYR